MSDIHDQSQIRTGIQDPTHLLSYLMKETAGGATTTASETASDSHADHVSVTHHHQQQPLSSWSSLSGPSGRTGFESPSKNINYGTHVSSDSFSRSNSSSYSGNSKSPTKHPTSGRTVTFTNSNGSSLSPQPSSTESSPKKISNHSSSSLHSSSKTGSHESRHHHRHHSSKQESPEKHSTSTKLSTSNSEESTQPNVVMAEKQTKIILKVIEQVIVNGVVVDEQVKETEFVTEGGRIPWTGQQPQQQQQTTSVTTTKEDTHETVKMDTDPVKDETHSKSKDRDRDKTVAKTSETSSPSSKGKESHSNNKSSTSSKSYSTPGEKRPPGRPAGSSNRRSSGEKRGHKQSSSSHSRDSSSSKKQGKRQVEGSSEESEDDRRMRETATALLELHTDSSPVKKMKKSSSNNSINEDNKSRQEPNNNNNNFQSLTFLPLKQGTTVLAKWTDKNFYAGRLVSSLGEGRWSILFDDGGKKTVHEADIIAIPHLTVGQVVMATFQDGSLCLKGVIKAGRYEGSGNKHLFYDVEYNDGVKMSTDKFSKKDIFLTPDLATSLLNTQSKGTAGLDGKMSKFADVDLNNIIPKRSRTVASNASVAVKPETSSVSIEASTDESETETTSQSSSQSSSPAHSSQGKHTSSSLHNKSDHHHHHHHKSSSGRRSQMKQSSNPSYSPSKVSRRDSESNHSTTSSLGHEGPVSASVTSTPVKSSTSNVPAVTVQDKEGNKETTKTNAETAISQAAPPLNNTANIVYNNPQEELLGPILPEGNTVFQGVAFLLTTADATGNTSDTEQGRSTAPFDIPHLVRQIESGSGRVFQTLEEAQNSPDSKEIVLLAYTYLRTVKYMQCLAAGIPCVMHSWVIECCKQNSLVKRDDFLLPSGYSITNNSLTTDRQVFKRSANLFKNVRFMLVSKNPRHAESWTSVLRAAHAIVVDDFPPTPGKASNAVDIIISDSTCPSHVIKRAGQLGVPIVTSEYVVQCLINGRRLPTSAHDKFSINHKSSSSPGSLSQTPVSSQQNANYSGSGASH